MNENWDVYPCEVNDAAATILVDLALALEAPQPERPHLIYVWIQLPEAGESGLPTRAALDAVDPLEERLIDALREQLDARAAGVINTRGRRELYFYAPPTEESAALITGILEEFPEFHASLGAKDDPEWRHYFEVLFPAPEMLRWMMDRRVVEQLEELGDPLSVPREVNHYCYFLTADDRAAFETEVSPLGFTVSDETEDPEQELAFGVCVTRQDPVDLDSINAVTSLLTQAAERAEGEYDGWEAARVGGAGGADEE
jgi:regulator of RNase E activity RraB